MNYSHVHRLDFLWERHLSPIEKEISEMRKLVEILRSEKVYIDLLSK